MSHRNRLFVLGPRPMRQRPYSRLRHRLPQSHPHRVIPPRVRRQPPRSAHSRITQERPRPHRHHQPALAYTTSHVPCSFSSPSFSPCPPDFLEQHSSSYVTRWSARSHPFSTGTHPQPTKLFSFVAQNRTETQPCGLLPLFLYTFVSHTGPNHHPHKCRKTFAISKWLSGTKPTRSDAGRASRVAL